MFSSQVVHSMVIIAIFYICVIFSASYATLPTDVLCAIERDISLFFPLVTGYPWGRRYWPNGNGII